MCLVAVAQDKLNLNCVSSSNIQELMRCIRSQAASLIPGLADKEMSAMALGLAHRFVAFLYSHFIV